MNALRKPKKIRVYMRASTSPERERDTKIKKGVKIESRKGGREWVHRTKTMVIGEMKKGER